NIIDNNTRIIKSSAGKTFLNSLEGGYEELDLLIEGIKLGVIKSSFFFGSPGTGKTSFAKDLAKLTNYTFVNLNISEIVDSRLGESIKNLEMFFKKNISEEKILFIDEADSLFTKRGTTNDVFEMERLLTVMLQVMDQKRKAVIIFASNLIDRIDKAILRRFDMLINFDKFRIDIDKAIQNSEIVNEWELTNSEMKQISKYIKEIHNPRMYDIDALTKKYLINSKLEKVGKKYSNSIKEYILQINKERSENE
ncbi:ATP-binding protein, partial [Mycoplasma marinum]